MRYGMSSLLDLPGRFPDGVVGQFEQFLQYPGYLRLVGCINVKYQVVLVLLALLAFGSCAAVEAIPATLDAAVVRAALMHFAKSKGLAPPKPGRYIAVDPRTRPLSESVSDDDHRRAFAALMPPPPFAAVTLNGRWTVVNAEYCFGLCAGNFVGEQ